jgi:hypothetical protein
MGVMDLQGAKVWAIVLWGAGGSGSDTEGSSVYWAWNGSRCDEEKEESKGGIVHINFLVFKHKITRY